jgi:hypothetical protein
MKRIPRPEELHAPLREALKKDMELSLSMAPLTARASVLRAEEREQRIDDNNPTDNNRVRALTGEPLIVEASGKSELDAVLLSLQDRNAARNRLGTIIRNQKAIASRLVCDEVRPEVTRLGKLFANAFLALHAAQHEYHSYLDQVENTGASIASLPNVFISGLGSARDLSGTFMYAMKDFIEAGFLQKADMPKVLQQ